MPFYNYSVAVVAVIDQDDCIFETSIHLPQSLDWIRVSRREYNQILGLEMRWSATLKCLRRKCKTLFWNCIMKRTAFHILYLIFHQKWNCETNTFNKVRFTSRSKVQYCLIRNFAHHHLIRLLSIQECARYNRLGGTHRHRSFVQFAFVEWIMLQ